MLAVSCDGCGTSAYVDCACPQIGHDPAVAGVHHPACGFSDLSANVVCPPGSGCCDGSPHPGISHDQAANACPGIGGAHDDPCPEPGTCTTWANMTANLRHPLYDGEPPADACPGGHCHKDLAGCTVCRPLTITVLPGSVAVVPAIGA